MVKLLKFPIVDQVETGTATTGTTGAQLVDSGQNFLTSVRVGDIVKLTVSGLSAKVIKVVDNNTLNLAADISAASGNAFTIDRIDELLAPVGDGLVCDVKSSTSVELSNAGHYSHHIKITATGANTLLTNAVNAAQVEAAETVWTEVVFDVKIPDGIELTAYTVGT